jgi:hypothetical protein
MIERITFNQVRPLYQYLREQAENKKAAKYLELAATFILISVFLFLAIKPTALAISSLVGEIKSKELASRKMKTKINSIIQAQSSYAQAQEKYSIIESSFPSNPNFYQAAVNFSTVAKGSSLDVKQLKFDLDEEEQQGKQKDDESLTKSFQMTLSSDGQYQSAISFIKEILNNRRLVDISSIRLSQPNNDESKTNSNIINLTVNSNLFYSPIEKDEEN